MRAPSNQPTRVKTPTGSSVIDRIGDIDFSDDEGIKLLVYGQSGSGKTTLWATFPKPILCLIVSGGNRPGELRSINTPENRKTIKQVVIQNPSEVSEVLLYAQEKAFKTVVLDHVTGLQDLVLADILNVDQLPAQKGWGMATQQQYGACTLRCKELLREMLSMPQNVFIVAQERVFDNDGDNDLIQPHVGAGLTPSLAGWLYTACDYICQTFKKQREELKETTIGKGKDAKTITTKQKVKGVDYCLRTGPDPVYTSKFRLPKGVPLPDALIDPDYDKILSLINGEVES